MGEGQLETDPAKIEAVQHLRPPSNVKELQSFLGFINFYRRLISDFARPAKALTQLLKKEATWNWGAAQQQAWEELRNKVSAKPIVRLPRPEGRYRLYTDWSA